LLHPGLVVRCCPWARRKTRIATIDTTAIAVIAITAGLTRRAPD
jgi:hypothetical protein